MSDRDDFGAFFVGFIVGGVTGAITSLLLAPQSGEETRTMIKDRAIEIRDQASTSVEETIARAEKAAQDAVKRAEELLEQARKRASELAEKGQVLLEEGKDKFSKTVKSTPKKPAEPKKAS